MAKALIKHYQIGDHAVGCRGKKGDEQLCLTDIWKVAGSPPNKEPWEWLRHEDVQEFIAFQCKLLNLGLAQVMRARKGKGGGTWAHWVIGIKYAAYLSKQLEDDLIRAWRQLKEEERDPELAADMSLQRVKNYYLKQGYTEPQAEEMAAKRLIGKAYRNLLTGEWQRRGALQPDYGKLTNAGYLGMYNQTAREMRKQRGLPPRANLRNHMDLVELAQTSFHEALTRQQLRQQNVYGVQEMAQVSHETGKKLAKAVDGILAPQCPQLPSNVTRPQANPPTPTDKQFLAS